MPNVKDIRTYKPIDNTREFFLDTNVLYWYTHPRYGTTMKSQEHQEQVYYDFVDDLVAAGNPIYTSILNITELVNVIEKREFELYKDLQSNSYYNLKDFRRDVTLRGKVASLVQTYFNNAKATCEILDYPGTISHISNYIDTYLSHTCDPFDYVILQNCIDLGKVNIITDDSDFSKIEGITIYTANPRMLK